MSTLPELAELVVLSPKVTRILGFNPSKFCLQGTNTYLVGSPDQRERILIDTGIGKPEYIDLLLRYLDTAKLSLCCVLITHWHMDHVGGIAHLREHFPDVPVLKYPSPARDPPDLYTYLESDQCISMAGVELRAVFTPGHSEDHLCFWLEEENAMFTGDTVLGHGTTIFIDYQAYMESLRLLQGISGLERLYPGHGQLIVDGPAKLAEYVQHRQEREQTVLSALREAAKPITTDEIVNLIYSHVTDDGVLKAAGRSLDQVLLKLESNRQISSLGDRWTLPNFERL